MYRYKNKEAKIKEWEELQKAQSETDMKKIEVCVSLIRYVGEASYE